MKKLFTIMLVLLALVSVVSCGTAGTATQKSSSEGGTGIIVWASSDSVSVDLMKKQVEAFKQANPDITQEITVKEYKSDAAFLATEIIANPDASADIFIFAQDQLARLVSAGCLSEVSEENAGKVKSENSTVAVSAASYNNDLYAYPVSSDNGYFMYYDKNVIKEDQTEDLATLVKACETADKVFCMRYDDSAWYNASFFIGTGCVSEWETDADGNFTGYTDTYNSDAGLKALKGLKILTDSPILYSATKALNFSKDAAVIISGTWDSEAVEAILGEDMGVADLPYFTVDGETYHMGSFAGYKMIGVKPQKDAETESVCHKLAAYLASEECQLERYEVLGWGPSNTNALNQESVKQNVALMALEEQSAYAIPQGQYPAEWWDIAEGFGSATKRAKTDADLKTALENYEAAIKNICK